MSEVTIRDAQPDDEDRLRALFTQGMNDAHEDAPDKIRAMVSQYAARNSEGDFADIQANYVQASRSAYLVAVIDGVVIGGVGLHPVAVADSEYAQTLTAEDREVTAELRRMTVDSAYRNLGVAKLLIQQLEATAASFGYSTVHLSTGKVMEKAWSMYERRGYQKVKEAVTPSGLYSVLHYSKGIGCEGIPQRL